MIESLQVLFSGVSVTGFWVVFAITLLAFAESLAIVGSIIPATPILLLIGTLLGRGALQPEEVIPGALTGALGGYWLSWAIGRRLRFRIYRSPWLAGRRRALARLRLFLRRWGGPSLILGRFVLGPLQSMLPLVAGTMGMPRSRFHFWNGLSGSLWVPLVLAPGYLAGRGLVPLGVSQKVIFGITLVLALVSLLAVVAMLMSIARQARHLRGGRLISGG